MLVAAVPACGSDPEGADPEAWTAEVCTELGTWLDRIQQRSSELQEEIAGVESLSEARTKIVAFLDDAVRITDRLLEGFDDAGRPAVGDGDELASAFGAAIRQARTIFVDGRRQAEDVPVNDREAFEDAAELLGEGITKAGDQVQSSFERIGDDFDAPAIDRAFASVPACARLTGGEDETG